MTAAMLPLQAAILSALNDALDVGSSPTGAAVSVYDDVPQGAAFPYVELGDDATAGDWSALATEGEEIHFHLHTWSRYRGKKEALQVMGAVKTALQNARLTVSGWCLASIREEFSTIFTDPDGRTRHGVQRFKALLRKAS
ncbi:MAG TPA: DUF3168 domain-containing protein [Azospirillum sp.]|nr:DUF3168 domain-containing protein [Azospirillum sp.]